MIRNRHSLCVPMKIVKMRFVSINSRYIICRIRHSSRCFSVGLRDLLLTARAGPRLLIRMWWRRPAVPKTCATALRTRPKLSAISSPSGSHRVRRHFRAAVDPNSYRESFNIDLWKSSAYLSGGTETAKLMFCGGRDIFSLAIKISLNESSNVEILWIVGTTSIVSCRRSSPTRLLVSDCHLSLCN